MPEDTPTKKVGELKQSGKSNTEIIQALQTEGYSFQQISEALNQTEAKASVTGEQSAETSGMEPSVIYDDKKPLAQETEVMQPPTPASMSPLSQKPSTPYPPQGAPTSWPTQPAVSMASAQGFGSTTEDVEELAESIIEEKWQRMTEEFGDLFAWKERTDNDLGAVKQELMRLERRFETLQGAVVGKVKEYGEDVGDVGVEIKALGKLLSNIINPLVDNVKALEDVVKELKK